MIWCLVKLNYYEKGKTFDLLFSSMHEQNQMFQKICQDKLSHYIPSLEGGVDGWIQIRQQQQI